MNFYNNLHSLGKIPSEKLKKTEYFYLIFPVISSCWFTNLFSSWHLFTKIYWYTKLVDII